MPRAQPIGHPARSQYLGRLLAEEPSTRGTQYSALVPHRELVIIIGRDLLLVDLDLLPVVVPVVV